MIVKLKRIEVGKNINLGSAFGWEHQMGWNIKLRAKRVSPFGVMLHHSNEIEIGSEKV